LRNVGQWVHPLGDVPGLDEVGLEQG